ncbi:hypothetical protein HK101_003165, partial [Irineochytrium annulatum]
MTSDPHMVATVLNHPASTKLAAKTACVELDDDRGYCGPGVGPGAQELRRGRKRGNSISSTCSGLTEVETLVWDGEDHEQVGDDEVGVDDGCGQRGDGKGFETEGDCDTGYGSGDTSEEEADDSESDEDGSEEDDEDDEPLVLASPIIPSQPDRTFTASSKLLSPAPSPTYPPPAPKNPRSLREYATLRHWHARRLATSDVQRDTRRSFLSRLRTHPWVGKKDAATNSDVEEDAPAGP